MGWLAPTIKILFYFGCCVSSRKAKNPKILYHSTSTELPTEKKKNNKGKNHVVSLFAPAKAQKIKGIRPSRSFCKLPENSSNDTEETKEKTKSKFSLIQNNEEPCIKNLGTPGRNKMNNLKISIKGSGKLTISLLEDKKIRPKSSNVKKAIMDDKPIPNKKLHKKKHKEDIWTRLSKPN